MRQKASATMVGLALLAPPYDPRGNMNRLFGALIVVGFCAIGLTIAGEKKKFDDPAPRRDAILKLFVAEFVPITPGKGKFPESFVMGSEKIGPDNERPAHKVTFKYDFAIAK